MNGNYIKKLIEQGENQQLDFKYAITDSAKIARSMVAFANTDGGTLLVGVKDNGSIAGVRTEEEYYMVEAAAQLYSRPELKFKAQKWMVEGRTVLEVKVPKSDKMPHSAPDKDGKWLVYIRVHDQNLLANHILLEVWKKRTRQTGIIIRYTEKEKSLLNYLENNELITISKFTRIAKIPRYRAEQVLIDFIVLNIVEMVFTEKMVYYKLTPDYKIISDQLLDDIFVAR